MSQLDKELLQVGGFKPAGAARILRRTRQAIYIGISTPERYFKESQVMVLLRAAIRQDSPHIDNLIEFIERNYPVEECEIIIPGRTGLAQVRHCAARSSQIVFGFNGNTEHLKSSAAFLRALTSAAVLRGEAVALLVTADWVRGYLKQEKISPPRLICVTTGSPVFLVPFVILHHDGKPRAFHFCKRTVEENQRYTSERMWEEVQKHLIAP